MADKRREWSVLSVKVPILDDEGTNTSRECTTQQELFGEARPVLTDHFSGAFFLNFTVILFNNLGLTGEFECAQQVLEGTYVFA